MKFKSSFLYSMLLLISLQLCIGLITANAQESDSTSALSFAQDNSTITRYDQWSRNNKELESFKEFLTSNQLLNIAPLEQLLRTATMWKQCGASEFEVPPKVNWKYTQSTLQLIKTLKEKSVIEDYEIVSAYRNNDLNKCAGGANKSSHKIAYAIDINPQGGTDGLCEFWKAEGKEWNMGLSKYKSGRVHIDTNGYRTWGNDHTRKTSFCR